MGHSAAFFAYRGQARQPRPIGQVPAGAFFYLNTPSKQRLNVRIAKGAVFMEQNQVIDEINYYKAQAITELLYARGMITFDEYDKLTDLNRQTFSPMYADLLPKSLEKSPNQS